MSRPSRDLLRSESVIDDPSPERFSLIMLALLLTKRVGPDDFVGEEMSFACNKSVFGDSILEWDRFASSSYSVS
jgi:hypothetical protein